MIRVLLDITIVFVLTVSAAIVCHRLRVPSYRELIRRSGAPHRTRMPMEVVGYTERA